MKDIEDEIPSITTLAKTDVINGVEDKIPNVSDLVKKSKLQ